MASAYDNMNYAGWDLSDRTDMNGLTIEGLCLCNSLPNAKVLPADLTGTTFTYCNLDNVYIPPGNTVDQFCSTRLFQTQNDGQDWLLDPNTLKPVSPLYPDIFIRLGLSTDPNNIPVSVT